MAESHELGKRGEALARLFLEQKGWTILETNWRFGKAEVDLIAKEEDLLVFVEVKTRSYDYFGAPEEAVNTAKEALLASAASAYMEKIRHEWEIRFDIIAILFHNEKQYEIKHLPDAFFPGQW